MKLKIVFSIILCIFSLSINAQDHHHLDHDSRTNQIRSLHVYEGGILYSVNAMESPYSRVVRVLDDGSHETIFSAPYNTHDSAKYYENADGSIDIFLVGTFELDVTGFAIIQIHYDGTTVTETREIMNSYAFARISDGSFRLERNEGVVAINNGVTTVIASDSHFITHIIEDVQGDIYYIDDANTSVYKEENGALTFIRAFGHEVNDLHYSSETDEFYIRDLSGLYAYTSGFASQSYEAQTPVGSSYVHGMDYNDGKVYLAFEESNGIHTVLSYTHPNIYAKAHEAISDKVAINRVRVANGRVITGNSYEDVTAMTLIENTPISLIQVYDFVDISLDAVDLEFINAEPSGPLTNFTFSVDVTVTNNGDELIKDFAVYSETIQGQVLDIPTYFSLVKTDANLQAGETKTINFMHDILLLPQINLTGMEMFIQGANFRIDDNMTDNVIVADITSSTLEQGFDNTIKLSPNPVENTLFVDGLDMEGQYTCHLIDQLGKTLAIFKYRKKVGIDVSQLHTGVYFLHCMGSEKTSVVKKFLKK